MREGVKIESIKVLAGFMILAFSPINVEAEEARTGTGGAPTRRFIERETMLGLMPSLKISKKTSVKYSIMQQFEYIDNFNQSQKDIESRFVSISSPAVSIKYPIGRSYLEGSYEYGFTYYMGHDDYINRHSANVKAYHRPTRRLSMGLTDQFTMSDRPELERDIDVKAAGETFNRNALNGELKYEINKRLRCGLEGEYSFFRFKEEPSNVSADQTNFSGGGIIDYVMSPHATVSAAYDFRNTLFGDAGEKDANTHSINLRYSHKVRKTITVNIRTSYDLAHYKSGEDINGATASASLNFDISRLSAFSLVYDYRFENSSRRDYLAYRTHGIQGNLRHHITPRCTTNIISSYDLRLYDPKYQVNDSGTESNRMNSGIIFECGIIYKLTKMIDIGATYNTNIKFSDFDDDSYFVNRYLLTMRATF